MKNSPTWLCRNSKAIDVPPMCPPMRPPIAPAIERVSGGRCGIAALGIRRIIVHRLGAV
nr:hypothetical protein [uncultured Roseateles sp.]